MKQYVNGKTPKQSTHGRLRYKTSYTSTMSNAQMMINQIFFDVNAGTDRKLSCTVTSFEGFVQVPQNSAERRIIMSVITLFLHYLSWLTHMYVYDQDSSRH